MESSKGDSSRSGSPARAAVAFEVSDLNAQPNKLRTGIAEARNPPPLCDTCDTLPPYRPFARVTAISQNRCHKCHSTELGGDPLPPLIESIGFFSIPCGATHGSTRVAGASARCIRAGARSIGCRTLTLVTKHWKKLGIRYKAASSCPYLPIQVIEPAY